MKFIVNLLIWLVAIPLVLFGGYHLFGGRKYAFLSLVMVILSFIPFFLHFEKKNTSTRKLILIAVMTALSVAGRFIFTVTPGFKPVTAIVVITALFFGSEAGFLTGVLSALISGMSFHMGSWTPFQMFAWGMIGLLAGLAAKPLKSNLILLSLYGVFSGILFSLIMDVWTVLWGSIFQVDLYLAALLTALPTTIEYAVSNVIFLLLLIKPIGKKLERIRMKYGID